MTHTFIIFTKPYDKKYLRSPVEFKSKLSFYEDALREYLEKNPPVVPATYAVFFRESLGAPLTEGDVFTVETGKFQIKSIKPNILGER